MNRAAVLVAANPLSERGTEICNRSAPILGHLRVLGQFDWSRRTESEVILGTTLEGTSTFSTFGGGVRWTSQAKPGARHSSNWWSMRPASRTRAKMAGVSFSGADFSTTDELDPVRRQHPVHDQISSAAEGERAQRTAERQERLVDIGPFVIPNAEAPKLIQPGKRALDDPPPPQAAAVPRAAHGQQRENVARPQTVPNRLGIVAAVAKYRVRPPPRSPSCALEWRNRIHQRQGFLRVVPVRARQANGQRYAACVANQMTLAPALGSGASVI